MAAPAPFGVESGPSPWVAAAPFTPPPSLPRSRRPLVAWLATGLVLLAGGGFVGTSLYAEQRICAAFAAADGDPAQDTELDDMARYVFLDGDLRTAIDGMTRDAETLTALQKKKPTPVTVAEMVLVAGSVNAHARRAQEACDLPAVGIFAS